MTLKSIKSQNIEKYAHIVSYKLVLCGIVTRMAV